MKVLALILMLVLLSGCVQSRQQMEDSGMGELSVPGSEGVGMSDLPGSSGADDSLVGAEVDLGSII